MSAAEVMNEVSHMLASASTPFLLQALAVLDVRPLTADELRAQAWMFDEIERRHPEVEPMMTAWAETASELTYLEALLLALPKEAIG